MKERLVAVSLCTAKAVAGTVVRTVKLPFDAILVGASMALDAVSGSPTGCTIDVNDDGSAPTGFSAVAIGTTAGAGTTVKTTELAARSRLCGSLPIRRLTLMSTWPAVRLLKRR